jgi:hypothetical protein
MSEQWLVEFSGRAGGHARAVFDSEAQARAFAERLAGQMLPGVGEQWAWRGAAERRELSTVVGNYCIARIDE